MHGRKDATTHAAEQGNETAVAWQRPGAPENIVSRMERLPLSGWQVRTRLLIGTGTFFDAVATKECVLEEISG